MEFIMWRKLIKNRRIQSITKRAKSLLLIIFRCNRYIFYRYFLKRYFSPLQIHKESSLEKVSNSKESFFGYYNLSPENSKQKVLICEPKGLILKLYVKDSTNYRNIGETTAWNWQQGCMLQWNQNQQNIVYYNVFDEHQSCYKAKLIDTDTGEEKDELPMPICSISKNQEYALSLNFERLALMRPDYGYFCNQHILLPNNQNDGIWKIDLNTKRVNLIISLQQLIELKPVESMLDADHKVNHIDISPEGNRFLFLHRWVNPLGRFMRLISADKNGNDLYILNGDKMISHSCWYGNDRIISFCYTKEYGNAYIMFTDKTNQRQLLSKDMPVIDGHPSVSPNGRWLITDTYPAYDRMSRIFLFDLINKHVTCIGRFYQPLKYNREYRIDLHPKWSMDGTKIYFESGHNGYRNLYVINIENFVK
jgi:hypothetical protein